MTNTKNRLTREQFLESANENRESDLSIISELEWKELKRSDYLLDRFSEYPSELKTWIHEMLNGNIPIRMIESLCKLLEKADSVETGHRSFMKIPNNDLVHVMKRQYPEVSIDFFREVLLAENDLLMSSFPWLLRHIYSEERTLEALIAWNKMNGPINTMYVIHDLFEQWEEFKDYPIEWSLNVLLTDEESTVDQTGF